MKYLIILIIILAGIFLGAKTEAAVFNWSLGEPKVEADTANTTYYCWFLGEPTVCYQYQAAAPPTVEETIDDTLIIQPDF